MTKASITALGLLSLIACGGALEADEDSQEPSRPELPPNATDAEDNPELAAQLDDEWQSMLSADPSLADAPLDGAIDTLPEAEPSPMGPDVDKIQMPEVYGWAVKGTNVLQSSTNANAHCKFFGRSCDNLVHSQADDISYTSVSDFADDLLGRCGRFDSTVDNSWKPCVVPQAQIKSDHTGKRWWISINTSGCPSDQQASIDLWKSAIADAGARWMSGANMIELVVTPNPGNARITIDCDSTNIPAGKIGIGSPAGALTLRYAPAAFAADDTCEDGLPGHSTLHAYMFSDMYYTYPSGRISVKFNDFMAFINGCGGSTAQKRQRMSAVMMHEIGHVLGLPHAQLPADLNPMNTSRSCNWALNAPVSLAGSYAYREAFNDLDTVDTTKPLTYYDEDISCFSPLGGRESQSD